VFPLDLAQVEVWLVISGLLLLAGVLASQVSARLGVPALLLFLGLGMLVGSDGLGGIDFDTPDVALHVGSVALAFILFGGGLDTRWNDVRTVLGHGVLLATVGVVITAGITGLVAYLVLDVPIEVALLLGAIVSSTDAAAVFSVLRSRSIRLRGQLRPLLELESGSNDPMAVLLTIAIIDWIQLDGLDPWAAVGHIAVQFVVGMGVAGLVAALMIWLLRHVHLDQQGLYPVASAALVVLAYALATQLGGSGFLAAYVAGLVVGNADVLHRRRLVDFHDAVSWFMQIVLFLTLGLLVFPSQLLPVALPALLILVALTVLARPVAVFACLPRGWSRRERLLVSWVGLRGAAPILLATFPLVAGIPQGPILFDVVFFVVLLSVLVQGTTIPLVARILDVDAPLGPPEPLAVERIHTEGGALDRLEVDVGDDAPIVGARISELALPPTALVLLLSRGDDQVIPQGATKIRAGDHLVLVCRPEDVSLLRQRLEG
jgi:potassium/hydrogen antiporter